MRMYGKNAAKAACHVAPVTNLKPNSFHKFWRSSLNIIVKSMKFAIFVLILFIGSSHSEPTKGLRDQVDSANFSQQAVLSNKSNDSKMGLVEILEAPLKPEYDKKSYRVIRLSNGLTAILVSTQENALNKSEDDVNKTKHVSNHPKKSACTLRVDVGSFSNPRDVQGLAHFIGNFEELFSSF